MNAGIDSARFSAELRGWGLQGVLCAASSFCWALVAGFNDPVEIAGMAAGIAVWVAFFAGFCVWHGQAVRRGPDRLVPALRLAAWTKFVLGATGGVGFALCSLTKNDDAMLDAGALLVIPDGLPGIASIRFVSLISGSNHLEHLDSFGWTALTTIIDGALVVIVIGCLTAAVLAWWRFGPCLWRRLRFSPARLSG